MRPSEWLGLRPEDDDPARPDGGPHEVTPRSTAQGGPGRDRAQDGATRGDRADGGDGKARRPVTQSIWFFALLVGVAVMIAGVMSLHAAAGYAVLALATAVSSFVGHRRRR